MRRYLRTKEVFEWTTKSRTGTNISKMEYKVFGHGFADFIIVTVVIKKEAEDAHQDVCATVTNDFIASLEYSGKLLML